MASPDAENSSLGPEDVRVRFQEQSKEDDGEKHEKAAALAKALTLISSKSTATTSTSRMGFASVVPSVVCRLFKGRTYRALYTIEEIEAKLYDIQHHDDDTRLLQQKSIISVDAEELDEEEKDVRSQVIRCFTDPRAKWAALALLFNVLVTFTVAPLTFMYGGTWSTPNPDFDGSLADMRAVMWVDICMDIMYGGHLLLQLNMSFMHPRRRVEVTCRSRILASCLLSPLYHLKWVSVTSYFWIAVCQAPLLINNLKFIRLLHWIAFPDPLWLLECDSLVRLGRWLFILLGCSHWVACLLFCVGGYREHLFDLGAEAPNLQFNGKVLPDSGHARMYLMALVESIYMMTGALDNPLGDGSARENNLGSLVVVSVFGPLGMVVVAILIAAVVREQALQFALEIRHEENMAFVTRALENLNIPAELQRRVVSLHYFQKMSHDTEAFSQLFNGSNLSGPLEDAIRVYLYHKVLCSPFFTNGGPNYLLAVVRVLEDRMYLPGDYVARRGEVGAEMFFISRGELSVLVPGHESDDIAHAVLIAGRKRKGQYFGEVALVKRSLRTAWVRAETYVIVSVLHRHCIEDIWEFFPQEREALVSAVTQTMERDKARQKQRWQDAVKEVSQAVKEEPGHCPRHSLPKGNGAFTVAALAMSNAVRRSHLAADNAGAHAEQEEKRHIQVMAAVEAQSRRLEALEQQVSSIAAMLGDAAPQREKSVHEGSKSTKKKKHKHYSDEAPARTPEIVVNGSSEECYRRAIQLE